ncbi:hypothetical protein ACAX43_26525 [Paraburkholderia sp. IW21]|uniref:hypothetical protein n=1 Tax=Paraburkholderia sp. IW21 TaxID=3242488 RepID=UPI0035217825
MLHEKLLVVLAIAIVGELAPKGAWAHDISPITATRSALPGDAYDTDKQDFLGGACVAGSLVPAGTATSSFSFQNSLSQSEAQSQLGIEVGGRAQFGAVSTSAAAKFAQSSTSSQYSISSIWLSDYELPTDRFLYSGLTAAGKSVQSSAGQWTATCGDEYVSEITRGAKLFFSIRIDFNSLEQKQSFQTEFSIAGPLYSVNATMAQASRQFSRDTKVKISAFQIGGDVSKITRIFDPSSNGSESFVQCTLGDLSKCAAVIQSALNYATDTSKGFPSQIAPGASPGSAPLLYRTTSYSSLGLQEPGPPFLSQIVTESRKNLANTFNNQLQYKLDIDRLLEFGLEGEKRTRIEEQQKSVDANLASLLTASAVCYDSPPNCPSAVSDLRLNAVNTAVLILPPLPTADYRLLTTHRGLWGRDASVSKMNERYHIRMSVPGIPGPFESSGKMTLQYVGDGEASAVIMINGTGLDHATLMFEDTGIRTYPLSVSQGQTPEKATETSSFLVVDSTRGNPGWRDINTSAEREALWTSTMPKADGVFYLLVYDVFGRKTRFDIDYQHWYHIASKDGSNCFLNESYTVEDRWWIPGGSGTSVAGTGPFSRAYTHGEISTKPIQGECK